MQREFWFETIHDFYDFFDSLERTVLNPNDIIHIEFPTEKVYNVKEFVQDDEHWGVN